MIFVLLILVIAVCCIFSLRQKRYQTKSLRQFERYNVAKDVMIQIGNQVVNAALQTLAVGELSFKTEQRFVKGQKIKLKISDEEIESKIVCSSENLKSQNTSLT